MSKQYYVYIMTNSGNSVLYTGVTGDLKKRAFQHEGRQTAGFTRKYNVHKLVYYEVCSDVLSAIEREKQIKAARRAKKLDMIKGFNPNWSDLKKQL
jgi:putative endonuclease